MASVVSLPAHPGTDRRRSGGGPAVQLQARNRGVPGPGWGQPPRRGRNGSGVFSAKDKLVETMTRAGLLAFGSTGPPRLPTRLSDAIGHDRVRQTGQWHAGRPSPITAAGPRRICTVFPILPERRSPLETPGPRGEPTARPVPTRILPGRLRMSTGAHWIVNAGRAVLSRGRGKIEVFSPILGEPAGARLIARPCASLPPRFGGPSWIRGVVSLDETRRPRAAATCWERFWAPSADGPQALPPGGCDVPSPGPQ